MAPTPHKETPLRRSTRVSSPAEDFIVVDTTPQSSTQAAESTMIDNRMAPTPYKETPLRRSTRVSSPAEDFIVVDTTPQSSTHAAKSTIPTRTPETRKRRIDFHSLHNYGFQSPDISSSKPSKPTTPITKRARLLAAEKTQSSVKESQSQATIDKDIQSKKEENHQKKEEC
jgi:hypothetical protein